ncbi:hypothetical protein Vadar_022501 [Vaccinium darrowii]|uniref:Uncharacterized protein n=1 Tax=Vaccinium darrowii TaxID=229202 RepID=A0ACB7X365_9ERIC|nr:hypothetical protein Vadar_022501 [Vaccinium darrowii]
MEDSKQLSPVSVLEKLPPDDYQAYYKYSQLLQIKGNSPHFLKPKLVSIQRKQLLFGKVTKEIQKVICKQISSQEKQYGDVKTISHQIHFDLSDMTVEWGDFQLVHEKIGIEIADAIMYDIFMEMILL